ncbi:unnamed protein product [Prunus armeniaca]|uniref:Peptidase S8/S53 domain-containing protein n=1 Tax=Prunus armeniaca TaxID=36596 RepID=A0A6J5V4F8_PRUAR|nr:unnamed protein product [Prunus armeniaca]
MNSPRDQIGHGITVASIYSCWELHRQENAIADGVDVIINISLGMEESTMLTIVILIGTFAAMEKGIIVSCAAGNEGPSSTVYNGRHHRSIACRVLISWKWNENRRTIQICWNTSLLNVPLVHTKLQSPCNNSHKLTDLACHGVVVCDDGYNTIKKIEEISSLEVLGAILISNSEVEYVSCACTFISVQDGNVLMNYVESTNMPLVNMNFRETITRANIRAPSLPYYASRGPSHVYVGTVKPDVMAPGSQILGARVPNKPAGYVQWLEFPSLASPHVTGLAALLKSAHPKWSPAAIRSTILTANPFDNRETPIQDAGNNFPFASPLAMGSGMILARTFGAYQIQHVESRSKKN